jgi:DNA-binding beta-propeller fold protein YncE
MLKTRLTALMAGAAITAALSLTAHAAKPAHEVVAKGLDNPTGVAVQPGTGHVFIASHAGVHRLDPKSGKLTAEVAGNPTDIYGKGPKYNIGPLGLAFIDANHLVVGDGSRPDGEELVRVYKVGNEAAAEPQAEGKALYTLGPIKAGEETAKGEGNFYGVAADASRIFVTCNGDDTKGWVASARVKDCKPGQLKLSIATKEATEVDAPGPVTFAKMGKAVIVGQIGEVNVEGDSLITIYTPKGKLTRKLTTTLNDVAGLAWSGSGKLYATDFSWIDASKGALYQLNLGKKDATEAKCRKILDLDKPTGIAFDEDGNAYIAVFGTAAEGSDKPAGQIIKVSGL